MNRSNRAKAVVGLAVLTALVFGSGLGQTAAAEETSGAESGQNFDHLIGRRYASGDVPVRGWDSRGGTLLRDSAGLWMSVFETPTGRYVFVTERFMGRQPDGDAIWRILDTATTNDPVPRNGYWAGRGDCRKDGNDLPRAVGYASGTSPYWNRARQLWNWSTPDGRLTPRRVGGVFCWTGNPD